ncbi:MAG TPA: 4-hydroxythreonine-4-phosphate dehydrogenase PdxA [Anaerohalosphaeraceae bacterium]|nr:4-hydroxythreonine-4-phosphate dehydrogenase PdxA [Anaerohalosphaeraceae bacterium]
MAASRPILGISMGDPAGIGPEIGAKALACKKVYEISKPILVGDAETIARAAELANVNLKIRAVSQVCESKFEYGIADVLDLKNVHPETVEYGKVSPMAGKAAFEAVVKAIALAMEGQIDAVVTGPINKESLNKAGYHYSGHTEIFAEYTKTKDYAMLLVEGNMRVVHVSTHVSLKRACELVKKERILTVIQLADAVCRKLGIAKPVIGVAGLNPHSGEGGLFGDEEEKEILPAVEQARFLGIHAEGPVPADTLFSKAKGGLYDITVAMYHDQGHIPVKAAGFVYNDRTGKWESVRGVNITLGLPIIRTSVDHGTAFDQAGKGTASQESMIQAIEYAVQLAS